MLVERNSRPLRRRRSTIGLVVRSSTRTNDVEQRRRRRYRSTMTSGDDHDLSGPGDAVHQEPESGAAEDETGYVEAPGVAGTSALQVEGAEDHGQDAHAAS